MSALGAKFGTSGLSARDAETIGVRRVQFVLVPLAARQFGAVGLSITRPRALGGRQRMAQLLTGAALASC